MEGVSKSCGLDLHLVSSVRQRLDLLTANPKGTEGSDARRNKRPNKVGCVDGVVILYEGFCCSVLRSDMGRGLRGYIQNACDTHGSARHELCGGYHHFQHDHASAPSSAFDQAVLPKHVVLAFRAHRAIEFCPGEAIISASKPR